MIPDLKIKEMTKFGLSETTKMKLESVPDLQPNHEIAPEGGIVQKHRSFSELLKDSVDEVNVRQKTSEQAMADMATGQIKDLHQAAIVIGKAENSMKLMLEVRNKAISAYKELIKTQM